jgi:hypothetical protein
MLSTLSIAHIFDDYENKSMPWNNHWPWNRNLHIGHLISNITVWHKIISNTDLLGLMILLPNNYFSQGE